jgi:RNA polymerase sigma-70 factor (ECF subfamily)
MLRRSQRIGSTDLPAPERRIVGDGPFDSARSYSRRAMGSGGRERAWVRGAQAGEVSSLEALFRHHWPTAYRAAYLVVHDAAAAEDIAQEAFLAAVRNLDRFDRRRPFGPWLHRIVVNRAIDWARMRSLRAEAGGDALAAATTEPGETELAEHILEAIRSLSPEHRAVIVLRHLLEYTPGEIARLLDVPRGTVNSRLRRALDALGERLGEER